MVFLFVLAIYLIFEQNANTKKGASLSNAPFF